MSCSPSYTLVFPKNCSKSSHLEQKSEESAGTGSVCKQKSHPKGSCSAMLGNIGNLGTPERF